MVRGTCPYAIHVKKATKKGGLPGPPFSLRILVVALDAFDVFRLPALRAFDYVELNLLTFLQAAKTVCLDGGEVYEYVFTILAADKTIALGIVKPLYCSCFHDVAVFLWC